MYVGSKLRLQSLLSKVITQYKPAFGDASRICHTGWRPKSIQIAKRPKACERDHVQEAAVASPPKYETYNDAAVTKGIFSEIPQSPQRHALKITFELCIAERCRSVLEDARDVAARRCPVLERTPQCRIGEDRKRRPNAAKNAKTLNGVYMCRIHFCADEVEKRGRRRRVGHSGRIPA